MIPKKSKYALTVTLLALSTACLATGCKKKHDKIDLSGSQAAESTVQTAPVSTTAAESETSSSITIEPGIENALLTGCQLEHKYSQTGSHGVNCRTAKHVVSL